MIVLARLYRLRRRAGLSRRLSLRLAVGSIWRDRVHERERQAALRRAQLPFVTSRAGDL